MELKEYLNIIKKDFKLFISVIVIIILLAFAWAYLRPVSYATSLTLNITRQGIQNIDAYRYDDFYRIQADEKFAETIVEWLKSPRIVADIYKEAGIAEDFNIRQLTKRFKPEKLSSQVVSVNYSAPDTKTAQNLAQAISKIISQNTQNLNKDQKEETWFEIVAAEPVIKKHKLGVLILFNIALLVSIFLAFWIVMFRHYLN